MAKKLVALFVMCIIVVAAMHVREAKATEAETYKNCFTKCHDECKAEGNGFTHCEVKCDTDCSEKEDEAKLNSQYH